MCLNKSCPLILIGVCHWQPQLAPSKGAGPRLTVPLPFSDGGDSLNHIQQGGLPDASSLLLPYLFSLQISGLSFELLMKSHCLCEPDLVGKEQANSPCSSPPPEHPFLSNCFPCKSDSARSCV